MILRALLNSVTPYLIAGALCIGLYVGWKLTSDHYEGKMASVTKQAFERETKIIQEQGAVSKQTQAKKDELQTRYDRLMSAYRGVRDTATQAASSPAAVPSQGLRLLEPDVQFLIRFAQQCANTEIERNDIIQKYDKLNGN